MNPRQRMRFSNKKAREWMIIKGYNHIWFKSHTRRKDRVYLKDGTSYRALDLWNLFDGICIRSDGMIVFFQVKTNKWPNMKPYEEFQERVADPEYYRILLINVKKINKVNKWEVLSKIL